MEVNLIFELENLKKRANSYNQTIEQISKQFDFVPKLKPKNSYIVPSPMRLNSKLTKKHQKALNLDENKIFLEDEFKKLETYYSLQEDEEIESDSTGELNLNNFKNELIEFKEYNIKTENVFPKVDSACPFKKSKLSKIFTKSFVSEGVNESSEYKRYNSKNEVSNQSNSPYVRKSSSILSFLEKSKFYECEILK